MRTRTMVWLCVLMLGLGVIGPVMAQTDQSSAPAAAELVYKGATVKTQVDVNGAAAVQLVGGLLDAAVAAAQQQAQMMQQAGPPAKNMQGQGFGPAEGLAIAAPMIGPARDIIKSLDHITVLDMTAAGEVAGDEFISYYQNLMEPRGWVPLLTVRGQGMPVVAAMMAPEGKGVLMAVSPGKNNEIVVSLLTTTQPIGELLGQLASAGQGAMPQIMAMMQAHHMQKPPAPPAAPAKPARPAKPHAQKAPPKHK